MPISSPPATYNLERPGTSGVIVGPEVAIMNKGDDGTVTELSDEQEGLICVRGEPCFRGYGKVADSDEERPETFLQDGWFDTGKNNITSIGTTTFHSVYLVLITSC